MRNHLYLPITLLAVLGWHAGAQAQVDTRQAPRLVVSITIDQLRSDYLETFATNYSTEGFKRLLEEGAVLKTPPTPLLILTEPQQLQQLQQARLLSTIVLRGFNGSTETRCVPPVAQIINWLLRRLVTN